MTTRLTKKEKEKGFEIFLKNGWFLGRCMITVDFPDGRQMRMKIDKWILINETDVKKKGVKI
jgi:hypothetical protein